MFKKELGELYAAFLRSAHKAIKRDGYLVFSVPHDTRLAYASHLKLIGEFTLYVHKSLSRKIYILKRLN